MHLPVGETTLLLDTTVHLWPCSQFFFVLENMYTSSQLLPVPKLTMINQALEKQDELFHVELCTEAHPTSHQHSGGEPESTRQ